jgi:hypothetical protein
MKCVDKFHHDNISNDLIHGMIVKNITKKLRIILEDDYDNFILTVERHEIILSGSFIIQCALNEYWDGSDIDMYTFHEFHDSDIFSWATRQSVYSKNESEYNNLTGIIKIDNYIKGENYCQPFQLITLERINQKMSVKSYLRDTFDFNICKNIYKIKNGRHILKTQNLSSIMHKEIQPNAMNIGKNHLARYQKYIQRDFKIDKIDKCDYVKYVNIVIPIVICDVDAQNKICNIYFLGKHITDDVWENENLFISYFESDMYSLGDICDQSGLIETYDTKGQMKMRIENKNSFSTNCPFDNCLDCGLHDHRHSSLSVYKKQTGEEYSCDVVLVKRTDKDFNYERTMNDTYEWLDVLPKKDSSYADLIDNRDNTYVQLNLQQRKPIPIVILDGIDTFDY